MACHVTRDPHLPWQAIKNLLRMNNMRIKRYTPRNNDRRMEWAICTLKTEDEKSSDYFGAKSRWIRRWILPAENLENIQIGITQVDTWLRKP